MTHCDGQMAHARLALTNIKYSLLNETHFKSSHNHITLIIIINYVYKVYKANELYILHELRELHEL